MRRAYWGVVVLVACNAGFLLSLNGLFWRSPETQRALLVLPLVSTGLGVGALVLAGALWWHKLGSLVARLYYLAVGLGALLFAWWLSGWNLLGFHLG